MSNNSSFAWRILANSCFKFAVITPVQQQWKHEVGGTSSHSATFLSQPKFPLAKANQKRNFRGRKLANQLGIAVVNLGLLLVPALIPRPVQGAEQIYIPYGPLEFSIPVTSLERFAQDGIIDRDLSFYAGYLTPAQLERLRQVLLTKIDITPVAIAQFLYSRQGEIILGRLAQIIETKARQPGFYAIRAALIKAAADPEGLTLLNVLQQFPTYGIRINSSRGFQLIDQLSNLIQQTGTAIAAVEQQSLTEVLGTSPPDFSQLPDLRQQGTVGYTQQTITLNDFSRGRTFLADLYLPTLPQGVLAPVIVISHGLGSDRQTFAYLGQHLASYGFAVAIPEHPGSNAGQIQALIEGFASEVTAPIELIDRPLDIKFLLNELERSFRGRLNLQQVGALGHSFGGYTVLALAGAQINVEELTKECTPTNDSLNLSLLLQCRALELSLTPPSLQDERVKAAIAINPFGSTIFGEDQFRQLQLPLMLVASSDDTAAPALPEQIQPFTWLTNANKYLVLLQNGTHFSTLASSSESAIPIPPEAIGPNPEIAQDYMKALSLAFFKTYITNEVGYQIYLNASYARFISEDPLFLSLVESLSPAQLTGTPPNQNTAVPSPGQ